jgi:hypothetical protein
LAEGVRNGAVPPDAWDDLVHDKQAFFPYELVSRFLKEGKSPAWIVQKIHHRVGHKRAEEMVRKILNIKAIIAYRMM